MEYSLLFIFLVLSQLNLIATFRTSYQKCNQTAKKIVERISKKSPQPHTGFHTSSNGPSQLLLVGVLESRLFLVIGSDSDSVSRLVFEVPSSDIVNVTIDLATVTETSFAEKWPLISISTLYPNVTQTLVRQAVTIERAMPSILMPTGVYDDASTFNRLLKNEDYHSMSSLEISLNPEHVRRRTFFTLHNISFLNSSIWLSTTKVDHFLVLHRHGNSFALLEYSLFWSSYFFTDPTLLWLHICKDGVKIRLQVNGTCSKAPFVWLFQVKRGFTDGKWFRLFTDKTMYAFSHKALEKPGKPVQLWEVPYSRMFTCKEADADTRSTLLFACYVISSLVFALIVITCPILCIRKCRNPEKRIPSNMSATRVAKKAPSLPPPPTVENALLWKKAKERKASRQLQNRQDESGFLLSPMRTESSVSRHSKHSKHAKQTKQPKKTKKTNAEKAKRPATQRQDHTSRRMHSKNRGPSKGTVNVKRTHSRSTSHSKARK